MKIKRKSIELTEVQPVESAEPKDPGVFTGYAAVFNNVDLHGDIILPGAFADSLNDYAPGGAGVPCYWNHNLDNPQFCIGWTREAREDEHGLFVEVQLDLENPMGKQVYQMLQKKLVRQMSFTYIVEEESPYTDEDGKNDITVLTKLKLFEVSVVPVGANQETEILDVKADTPRRGAAALDETENNDPSESQDGSEEDLAEVEVEEGEIPNIKAAGLDNSRVLAMATEVELCNIRLSIMEGNN
jgi:HK97 family phage prohead protease